MLLLKFAIALGLVCPLLADQVSPTLPRVAKDSHAEAILWEVWVSDDVTSGYPVTVMKHYLRVIVFDARGAEMLSKVDLPHFGSRHIFDVWAKTTKKNGDVIELKKDGVFERMVAKAGGLKIKSTSFALPGLEPGAIVEYGWREREDDKLANYVRLPLQREYPVQTVRYHIKPLQSPYFPYGMRAQMFHTQQPPFERERDGFVGITFTNMPALHEEPDMPPENEVSRWMLIYYAPDKNQTPDQYWHDMGKEVFDNFKQRMKVNGDIKRKAAELIEAANTDEEKLKRLFLFCRSSIRNIADPAADLTPEQRMGFKENNTPADTLKRGIGTGRDIDLLFAALANAAGFEARYARGSDRSQYFFQKNYANAYFLQAWQVAVRVNDKWQFFDPASTYVPFGMLRWQEEGAYALLTDSKESELIYTPVSAPDKSARRRLAQFELSEDGTLDGTVKVSLYGHRAAELRREYSGMKEDARRDSVKEDVENQFPGAEVTDVKLDNVPTPELPLVCYYHIKIPGYAQRTGKRLFLQPAVFQRGHTARFTAATRTYPVYFHYPWMDVDHLVIKVPEGFELDNADMPPSLPLKQVGHYTVSAQFNKVTRALTYHREFVFGENLGLVFPVETYPALKTVFETVHSGDNHAITFKQAGTVQ